MEVFVDLIFNAIKFAALGVSLEVLYTGLYARFKGGDRRWMGHVSVKMFPAYVLLAFIFPFLQSLFATYPFYARWAGYAFAAHVLEFWLGAWFLWRTGEYHWRYQGLLSFRHHTDLSFFPIFFLAAGLFEWVFLHVHVR